jgi:diphthine synthase
MLVFVGLGLGKKGISLMGLEEARRAEAVYAELYTSLVPGLDLQELEQEIGKRVKPVDRETLEKHPDEILTSALSQRVVLLVPGDPMVATTHVDLRLRAAETGIKTKVVHGASISSAAPGSTGLQSYKFGRTATIPFPDNPSETPYLSLVENHERGLHTLLLLDIRAEKNWAMTANEAIEIMLKLEEKLHKGVFTPETLAVVVARAGAEDEVIKGGRVQQLGEMNFGQPPHVLIVPGKLHFMEAEALRVFAQVPPEMLK